ncbi:ion transporter [Meiothermus luteus]|uniref:ion transporter n=1 Tax=Meiothermus luteus TaxID=2026184 RepID=UPI001FECFEAC|nr:ion transporter [Meiothermus luteus]
MQNTNPLKSLVESAPFNRGVTAAILFAAGLVGLETYPELLEAHGALLKQLNHLVLSLFVVELLLRFAAEWPHPLRFFRGWNLFDLTIVALSLLPGLGEYAVAARLLRLLRVLRLIRTLPELQVILGALLRSIPSIGYVFVLLLLLLYVYAVAGVFLFGANDPFHFGNLHKALLTLFGILTLEGWVEVFRIQYFGCQEFALPQPELCTAPQAQPLAAAVYMLSFVLLGTLIFLNLLVGIVVNSMDEMRKTLHQPPAGSEEAQAAIEERLKEALALLQRLRQG